MPAVCGIPGDWMKELRAGDKVDVVLRGKELVIRPAGYHPRQGWEKALRAAAESKEEPLCNEFPPTQWDLTEWEW